MSSASFVILSLYHRTIITHAAVMGIKCRRLQLVIETGVSTLQQFSWNCCHVTTTTLVTWYWYRWMVCDDPKSSTEQYGDCERKL